MTFMIHEERRVNVEYSFFFNAMDGWMDGCELINKHEFPSNVYKLLFPFNVIGCMHAEMYTLQ